MPKISPSRLYSVTIQFIRDLKGMGYILSDIKYSSDHLFLPQVFQNRHTQAKG